MWRAFASRVASLQNAVALFRALSLLATNIALPESPGTERGIPQASIVRVLRVSGHVSGSAITVDPNKLSAADSGQLHKNTTLVPSDSRWPTPSQSARIDHLAFLQLTLLTVAAGLGRSPPSRT